MPELVAVRRWICGVFAARLLGVSRSVSASAAVGMGVAVALGGCGGGNSTPPFDGGVRTACRVLAHQVRPVVLCPTWLPATRAADGAFETLRVDPYGRFPGHGVTYSGGCSYLISLNTVGPAERAASSDRVPFHMLVGGDCRPFPLSVIGGYWPPVPSSLGGLTGWRSLPATEVSRLLAEEDRFDQRYLELPSEAGLKPGTDIAPVVLPRVVASARVRGLPALVLEVAPYPAGGLHGGHYAIVWNQGVAGYVLSFHYERGSRGLPPRASDIRALVRAADDMRPAH